MEEHVIDFCQLNFGVSARYFHIYQPETFQDIDFGIDIDNILQRNIEYEFIFS